MKRRLALVFGFVFIDVLGYSLILPLLPYYAGQFGASLTVVGLLSTSNAVAKLIAAPVIGRLSDRYGRRPLLIFSIVGTVLSFLVLGFANSLFLLFLSRVLDGLLGGNVALARAYITDITDQENRARGLGRIGAAFGIGFIIGPAIGGFLSQFGYAVPAFVAAGFSLLNLIAVIIWLPESLPEEKQGESSRSRFNIQEIWEALHRPCMGPLLLVRLGQSLAFGLFQTNFSLYAKSHLGLEAQSTSYILTYVGLLSALTQGLIVGELTDRFPEKRLLFVMAIVLTISLFAWGWVGNVWTLLVVMAPLAFSTGVLNTVIGSLLTKSVYEKEVGGTLGLSSSARTLSQIVTPTTGAFLLEQTGPWAVGLLGAALMGGVAYYSHEAILPISEEEMAGCREAGAKEGAASGNST
jgi:DHA1 family tetracycline resistance protein-like MFS transporter